MSDYRTPSNHSPASYSEFESHRIRRDALGRWYDNEVPIEHPGLVNAFNSWIDRDSGGRYCLRNSINSVPIELDGAPVFVEGIRPADDALVLSLSDQSSEKLDPNTLYTDASGLLYCLVRGGRLEAQFRSGALSKLAPYVAEEGEGIYFTMHGNKYYPRTVSEEDGR